MLRNISPPIFFSGGQLHFHVVIYLMRCCTEIFLTIWSSEYRVKDVLNWIVRPELTFLSNGRRGEGGDEEGEDEQRGTDGDPEG